MARQDPERSAFRPLDPPRNLTAELASRLRGEITSGRLEPNQRLPTEQEMIAAFGVSRTVVREAIAALRAEGLVETRQGAGGFVTADPGRRPFRIDPAGVESVAGVLQLMELRMPVEVAAAGLAAERRTAAQMRSIENTLKRFALATRVGKDAIEPDYDFHRAVGDGANNHYFVDILRYLGRIIIPRRTIPVDCVDQAAQRAYLATVLAEHREISAAIRQRDADAARAAMERHLVNGRERYRRLDARGEPPGPPA